MLLTFQIKLIIENMRTSSLMLLLTACGVITACVQPESTNGTTSSSTSSANSSSPNGTASSSSGDKPTTGFHIAGQVSDGNPVPKSHVTVYDATHKVCGTVEADDSGAYVVDVTCSAPLLVSAEAVATEGEAFYSVITGTAASGSAKLTISPVSTAVVAVMLGADPRSMTSAQSGVFKKAATDSNQSVAVEKVRQMISPALKAFSAEKDDFMSGDAISGLGYAQAMANMRLNVDVDNMIGQYTVTAYMPFLAAPVILKNNQGGTPQSVIFDTAYGVDPATVDTTKFATYGPQIDALISRFKTLSDAQAKQAISNCFVHDGFTNVEALSDFGRNVLHPETIRVEKFNIETVFGQEDNALPYSGTSPLAYISMDSIGQDGRKRRVFMWATNGSISAVNNCVHQGTDWAILGNQRQMYVRAETYLNFRDNYDFSLHKHDLSTGIGLEFYIGNDTNDPMSHVLVTGPGLPLDGVVLVNDGYDYVVYSNTLQQLRTIDPTKFRDTVIGSLKDTKAIALTDDIIAPKNRSPLNGIVDRPYDPHNKYTFRVYRNSKDLVPAYIFRDTLNKRPYLSAEVNIGNVPTLAIDRDELVAGLVNFTPVRASWSLPFDNRGVKLMPYDLWMGRVATEKYQECATPKSCVTKFRSVKTFTMPGSYKSLGGNDTSTYMQGYKLPGDLDYGFARLRTMDSFNRPVQSEIFIQMTTVKPKL